MIRSKLGSKKFGDALRRRDRKAGDNYSAYAPVLPGWIAAGETVAEVERELREAIRFHTEGLGKDGLLHPGAEPGGGISRGVKRMPRRCANSSTRAGAGS
jgi:predicted RNase H-like HicB family nuclease